MNNFFLCEEVPSFTIYHENVQFFWDSEQKSRFSQKLAFLICQSKIQHYGQDSNPPWLNQGTFTNGYRKRAPLD
jgi:hypothetical protein